MYLFFMENLSESIRLSCHFRHVVTTLELREYYDTACAFKTRVVDGNRLKYVGF
jgi:hypothetical protein